VQSILRVLFLAAEADPFVKIGGLGDVAGSLPRALREIAPPGLAVDVRLALPLHGAIHKKSYALQPVVSFPVAHQSGPLQADVYQLEWNGVPVYFIAGEPVPAAAPVYSGDNLIDGHKYTFFSLAALELCRRLDWQPDVLHANDWHTAPAVYALQRLRSAGGFFQHTASVLGVHNLPYLGVGAEPALEAFGLPAASGSALPAWAVQMPLPLGLLSADQLVAVSPTYAKEILTPAFGSGLHKFLRTRQATISGILNGLDMLAWDPEQDPALSAVFNSQNLSSRLANKLALQREFNLPEAPNTLLFGMVSRMDHQKGVDLMPPAFRALADQPWQVVVLGSGTPAIEDQVREFEAEFPDRVRAAIRFDAALSRRIFAGSDALLIPSRYEPCGLTQMIAMRYGCVPVARATGGLRDTITDRRRGAHNTGLLFKRARADDFAVALGRALDAYNLPAYWQTLQRRGMAQDFSWARFARQYLDLYLSVIQRQRSR